MNLIRSPSRLAAAAALTAMLAACASTPAPNEQLAVAEAAVAHANTGSTSQNAPAELQTAVAKLAAAREAARMKENARGRQLAEEAVVDAQVAEARAQAVRSRKAAQESQDAARALREELERKAAPR